MDYLINKHKGNVDLKDAKCECCSATYKTNINRTRCSKKCSKIMKFRRAKVNAITNVKIRKETMNHINKDVFGFISSAVY